MHVRTFDFCIPTRGIKVPGPARVDSRGEVDGYRLRVERDGECVRLITRGGYNWTKRYPWMVEGAGERPQTIRRRWRG